MYDKIHYKLKKKEKKKNIYKLKKKMKEKKEKPDIFSANSIHAL